MNSLPPNENLESDDIASPSIKFCSGTGRFHTDNPANAKRHPYTSITWREILEKIDKPQSVDKAQAQWFIPSTLLSRESNKQREQGAFWLLVADIDNNPQGIEALASALEFCVLGVGIDFEIYTSKSATLENQKCRVLAPLSTALDAKTWTRAQKEFGNLLAALGFEPDRAAERPSQIFFLPNAGKYYRRISCRGGVTTVGEGYGNI